jgi:ABC-type uncharacterized transport system auxiliary subunit
MRRIQLSAFILFLLLAGIFPGCGAPPPIRYYVLDIAPAPASSPSAQYPVTLVVGRIASSGLYRDNRLVYGVGAVQLGTYEYQRWAASPDDMIAEALVSSLRSTGQYRSVVRVSSNVRGDYIIRGQLYGLYEVDKPELAARVSLQLELFDPKTRSTLWSDTYTHDEPAHDEKMPDIVEAFDRNVGAGMKQLTANLGQYFASHPPETAAAH